MKKIFILVAMATMLMGTAMAETTIKREGKTFVATATKGNRGSGAKATDFSYTDTDGKTYQIWLSKNGHAYIKRASGKTGKEYNKYLTEEVSREICKEVGMTYVPSAKKSTNK